VFSLPFLFYTSSSCSDGRLLKISREPFRTKTELRVRKILSLALSMSLTGCVMPQHQSTDAGQCVGVMSSQDAYGYLDPNHYTMQVLALKKEKDVKEYIRNIDPRHPVWVNWKNSRGTRWYTVTVGDFKSKQDAYSALSSLPSRVKQSSPFVLTFGEMQSKQQTNVVRMR
jgi:septal ring-binding cell division protein DamX